MKYKMTIIYLLLITVSLLAFTFFYKKNSTEKIKGFTTVLGIIEEIYLQEIPNKARGKAPKVETNIKLELIEVFDPENRKINLSDFDYPTFAGNPELKDLYNIGDKVRIVCTSRTGRHIKEIKKIEN